MEMTGISSNAAGSTGPAAGQSAGFSYDELTTRNLGFVTQDQQDRMRAARVFVCGTGGMGGACVQALVRMGIGHLMLADLDVFEVSNLNRQLFATLASVGRHKAHATRDACLQINPAAEITVFDGDWADQADRLIAGADVVVNGTDDLAASLILYRRARALGKVVIDAYAAPLPSIYVTRPGRPMPEERLHYPTLGTEPRDLSESQRAGAFLREAEYVMLHSSSRHHIDLALAGEVAAGKRSRMSFAPMVVTTGMLMAYEVAAIVTGQDSRTDERGWFFNPMRGRVEHPRNAVVAAVLRPLVRRALQRMTG